MKSERRRQRLPKRRSNGVVEAVIFDLDGTVVDSNELHVEAWRESFREYGKDFPTKELHRQIGKGGDKYLPEFLTERELREFGKELEQFRGRSV